MKQEEVGRNKVLVGVLNEDYKTSRKRFMDQGIESEIVDDYISKFKSIRDKNYKQISDSIGGFDIPTNKRKDIDAYKEFHDLELFVDYVGGQIDLSSASIHFEDIQVDGKPVYNKDGLEIYYADTPRSCIKYKGNVPYSWCIARSDASNMFYTYRFKGHEPAFYFVKNTIRTKKEFGLLNIVKDVFNGEFNDKYHFFVIQVPKNVNLSDVDRDQFIVTSAKNDGDEQMSWNDLLKIEPKLNGAVSIFQPKPIEGEEKERVKKMVKGVGDDEFASFDYKQKSDYLDIYVRVSKLITDEQFSLLPEDLKNKYINFGLGLSNIQYGEIKQNKKLEKRYFEITKIKYEEFLKGARGIEFSESEFPIIQNLIPNDQKSDLFKDLLNDSEATETILEKYFGDFESGKVEYSENFYVTLDSDEFDEFFGGETEWVYNAISYMDFGIEIEYDYINLYFGAENKEKVKKIMAMYGVEYGDDEGDYYKFFSENGMEKFVDKVINDTSKYASNEAKEVAKIFLKDNPFNYDDQQVKFNRNVIANFMIKNKKTNIDSFRDFLISYGDVVSDVYNSEAYDDIILRAKDSFDTTRLNDDFIKPFLDQKIKELSGKRTEKVFKTFKDLNVDDYNTVLNSKYKIELLNINPKGEDDTIDDPTIEIDLFDKKNDKHIIGNVKLSSISNYINNYELFEVKKTIRNLIKKIL